MVLLTKVVLTVLNGFLGICTGATAIKRSKDESVVWLLTFITVLCACNIILFWRL